MTSIDSMTTGKIRDVINLIEPDTEADPAGVLAALLSQASCYLGNYLHLDDGGRMRPVIIDTLLIGPTNKGRKGTALGAASRVFDIAAPDFLSTHEVSGAKSGSGIIAAYVKRRDAAQEAQLTSIEAGRDYEGIDPKDARMFLVEEEYASVLKSGKRDATLQAVMRKTWDGADLQNMTKDGGVIRRPVFVIHGHVSPTEFRHNLHSADVAGGSFNRLLCVSVIRSKKLKKRHRINKENQEAAGVLLGRGLAFAQKLETISLSDDAIDLFDDGLSDEIEAYGEGMPIVESFVGRAEEYTSRVAALYAALDEREEIGVLDVKAAWNFVKFCLQSITDVLQGSEGSNESRIRAVLRKNPQGVRATELLRATGLNAAAIENAVANMDDVSLITIPSGNRGGRPSKVYTLIEDAQAADDVDTEADEGEEGLEEGQEPDDASEGQEEASVPNPASQPDDWEYPEPEYKREGDDGGNDFAALMN
ncbi:hypothetical protein ADL27_32540 [Streptomyces sp. NRRL F-6602]|nr:hypothetical protein ADL27_32540 [Streptomyces sp. NRRL F-6602]